MKIKIVLDGDQWCAYREDTFINLQESLAGFGESELDALKHLLYLEEQEGYNNIKED